MQNEGRLLLVRHGETSANINRVWHGHTDTPLTDLGEEQTVKLGRYFHHYMPQVDVIYASPLQRARNTAQQIATAFGHSLNLDERLMEFGVGDWEGKSFDELNGELDFFGRMMTDEHHRAPAGESRFEVTQRFVAAVEEFRGNHQGENIVVVAHGMAISFALAHWVDNDSAAWLNYRVNNTAVTEIDLNNGNIQFLDRRDHL